MLANLSGFEFIPAAAVLMLGLAINLFPEIRWLPRWTVRWNRVKPDDIGVVSAATPGAASMARDTVAARVLEALGERYGDVIPEPVDRALDQFTVAAYRWRVHPRFAAPTPDWTLAIDFHEKTRRSGAATGRRVATDRDDVLSVLLCASFGNVLLTSEDVNWLDDLDPDYEIEHLGRELARRREFDMKVDFDPRTLTRAIDLWCSDLAHMAALLEPASLKEAPGDERANDLAGEAPAEPVRPEALLKPEPLRPTVLEPSV